MVHWRLRQITNLDTGRHSSTRGPAAIVWEANSTRNATMATMQTHIETLSMLFIYHHLSSFISPLSDKLSQWFRHVRKLWSPLADLALRRNSFGAVSMALAHGWHGRTSPTSPNHWSTFICPAALGFHPELSVNTSSTWVPCHLLDIWATWMKQCLWVVCQSIFLSRHDLLQYWVPPIQVANGWSSSKYLTSERHKPLNLEPVDKSAVLTELRSANTIISVGQSS